MSFFGCFFGCLAAEFLWKYFTSKVDRFMFEYKTSKEIERKWLEE